MTDDHDAEQGALRAANLAISGRRRGEAHRFASIDLRLVDAHSSPWEVGAIAAVAVGSLLVALGVWFL